MNVKIAVAVGFVVVVLIVLGDVAALILYGRTAFAKDNEIHGESTFWGVFIVGLILQTAVSSSVPLIAFWNGIFLAVLAVVALGTLLFKAATANSKEVHGKSSLWGIFIAGFLVGLWLIVKAGSRR